MLADYPQDTFLNYAIGLEYWKAGEYKNAYNHLSFIRLNDPAYLANYYQLGNLALEQGSAEEALKVLQEGIEVARQQEDFKTLGELQSAKNFIETEDDDEDEEEAFS